MRLPFRGKCWHWKAEVFVPSQKLKGRGMIARTGWCWLFFVAVIVAADAGAPQRRAWSQSVWELLPYQVEVCIGVRDSGGMAETLASRLANSLGEHLARTVGAIWQWQFRTIDQRVAARLLAGELWPRELWPAEWTAIEHPDKAILLIIDAANRPWIRLAAQEIDLRSQSWGPRILREVAGWHLVSNAALEAVWEAFCPLARLHLLDTENHQVQLRGRASALAPQDQSLQLFRPGQAFRIVIRYNDRTGRATRIVEAPFSYVELADIQEGILVGRLVTGLRSPLSARRRGRTEQLFVATKAYLPETQVVLRDRQQPGRPLAAYSVFTQSSGGGELRFLGRTDAFGILPVSCQSGGLQILWVKNGQVPLARLPLLPGSVPQVVAELPSDDERMEAEGILLGIQEELLEIVVRRHILMARIHRLVKLGQKQQAQQLLEELRSLRSRDDLRRYLLLQRKRLVAKDPVAQKRIDLMFAKTEELLSVYLDPTPIDELVSKFR